MMKDYIRKEWDNIVEQAHRELNGTCPLIEDEIIVHVDEYIRELEEYLKELSDEIRVRGEK